MSSINRVLRNLASKSFDSSSSTSSSTVTSNVSNTPNVNQEEVYDKIRLFNNSQPWSHSAWYMPSAAAAVAASAAFSHMNGQNSQSPYGSMNNIDPLNENQNHHLGNPDIKLDLSANECKKGKLS